jgi:hypothetical protein
LVEVIRTGAWRHYSVYGRQEVRHDNFMEFLTATPWDGLGCKDTKQIERLCADDPEAVQALRDALKGKPGGVNQYNQEERGSHDNVMQSSQGNSLGYTLDRLSREHSALYQRVLDGELTANAAAIEAGFRTKKIQIEPTVEGFARATSKYLTDAEFARMAALRGTP